MDGFNTLIENVSKEYDQLVEENQKLKVRIENLQKSVETASNCIKDLEAKTRKLQDWIDRIPYAHEYEKEPE